MLAAALRTSESLVTGLDGLRGQTSALEAELSHWIRLAAAAAINSDGRAAARCKTPAQAIELVCEALAQTECLVQNTAAIKSATCAQHELQVALDAERTRSKTLATTLAVRDEELQAAREELRLWIEASRKTPLASASAGKQ